MNKDYVLTIFVVGALAAFLFSSTSRSREVPVVGSCQKLVTSAPITEETVRSPLTLNVTAAR